MNFELLPILTDYANEKKGGMKFQKNLLLWLLLRKIEISSIVHFCYSISQNELQFKLHLHGYVRVIFLKFFYQPIYTDYAN